MQITAWDDMPNELQPVLAREMEVYAGFLEHTDHHIGRLVNAIEDLGVLHNTIIYYIIGDNGASAEGTLNGDSTRWPTSMAWPPSRPRNSC
jgi:arylsulfatase A-like enzyme